MNILETIAQAKRREIDLRMAQFPVSGLEKSRFFNRSPLSLTGFLNQPESSGIIAEFKRRSPSKGILNREATVEQVTTGYREAGASGLSILTDSDFFGGVNDDLERARELNDIPVLRKDFILDPWQVIEAKAIGADAILLIAAILNKDQVLELARLAAGLGLETILEIHSPEELNHRNHYINMIGVNNRNLADFRVDMSISIELANQIGSGETFISESGIREPADVINLKAAGYSGFLIGEHFMVTEDPAAACRNFISTLKQFAL